MFLLQAVLLFYFSPVKVHESNSQNQNCFSARLFRVVLLVTFMGPTVLLVAFFPLTLLQETLLVHFLQ